MKNIFKSSYTWLLLAIILSVVVSFFTPLPAYLLIAPLFAYIYIKNNGIKNIFWILIPISNHACYLFYGKTLKRQISFTRKGNTTLC